MADENTFYGKGIKVASGFDLGAEQPLDSRLVVDRYAQLEEHLAGGRAYEGMIVYVVEHGVNYQLKNGKWESFSVEVQDTLDSYSTVKGLSANQGRILKQELDTHTHEVEELVGGENLATKEYVDSKIGQGGGSGNANIHVGDEEPVDKTHLWIDTTAPCTLDPNTYEGRLRLNYISMLNKTLAKTAKIEQGITLITSKIKQISSDKASVYSEQLSEIK